MQAPEFKTSALFSGTTGKEAEVFVCRELERAGHTILEQNATSPFGEIDIIASVNGAVCFIEVKYRQDNNHGDPAEFVTISKQRKIYKTALWWLQQHPPVTENDPALSFDVAAITGMHLNYIANAYEVPSPY